MDIIPIDLIKQHILHHRQDIEPSTTAKSQTIDNFWLQDKHSEKHWHFMIAGHNAIWIIPWLKHQDRSPDYKNTLHIDPSNPNSIDQVNTYFNIPT